jgi:hypothetical protein
VEHLKGASLGQALALPANIRLGWKGLPGTNTLAYYKNPQITDKTFYNIGQWCRVYKPFFSSSLTGGPNKLEYLSKARFFRLV